MDTDHAFTLLILYLFTLWSYSAQQKDDRKILKRWRWSCVLMDEAHALKDKNSYRWKNLMSVARSANQRLMLTGTPLQNDLHVLLFSLSKYKIILSSHSFHFPEMVCLHVLIFTYCSFSHLLS